MPKTPIAGRFSVSDVVYAVDMAVASLVAYWITTRALSHVAGKTDDMLGGMWAVLSTAFVFRDTSSKSVEAGLLRLMATCISFALCLIYLLLFPFTPVGLAVLLALGALVLAALDRRDEIVTASITTAVVMVVAGLSPEPGWLQPILRLVDTLIGVGVGVAFRYLGADALSRFQPAPTR